MSAIRISVPGQPVRLIDLGPQSARLAYNPFAVAANVGDAMMPILKPGGNSIAEEGRGAPKAFSIHPENRFNPSALPRRPKEKTVTRCSQWMPRAKANCDRGVGHRNFHSSRVALQRRLAVRRDDRG